MKIKSQVSVSFIIILLILTFIMSILFFQKAISIQFEEMRNKLIGLAVSISSTIDGDSHELLTDMNDPYYLELRNKFINIVKHYPTLKFIYTMRKTDKENILEFVIDSSIPKDLDEDGIISELEDITPLGEQYDISKFSAMKKAFNKPSCDNRIMKDRWGDFLSGYAPIYNSNEEVVGIVGVDITANTIRASQIQLIIYIIILSFCSIVFALIIAFLLSHKITKPIVNLAKSAEIIGNGNLEHTINLIQDDEIGFLAKTMNSMTFNLKNNLDKLKLLYETATILSTILDLNDALKIALNIVFDITKAKRGLIILNDRTEKKVEIAISEGINNIKCVSNECFIDMKKFDMHLGDDFISMIKEKPAIYQKGTYTLDERFSTIESWLSSTNCSLCIPLIYKSNLNGFFIIETDLQDYDFLSTLIHQVGLAIENARLYSEAITDGLTGLYIYRYFEIQLDAEYNRAKRYGSCFSIMMIDIDDFKSINDKYGHQTGDIVLKTIAQVLKKILRTVDLIFRYGGDELAIILPETSLANASIVAEKVRKSIDEHNFVKDIDVTLSIGISSCNKEYSYDKWHIVKEADLSLYKAKEMGKNRVVAGKTIFE